MLSAAIDIYGRITRALDSTFDAWFLGLLARFIFLAVLFVYFINSALTKVNDGVLGFFTIKDGAYAQILPAVFERFGYDASQVPIFPYGIIVAFGTYSEFILPILIVLGLFTRIAAFGMIVFVVVQSYVDVAFHQVDAATLGAWFDKLSNGAIMDQRFFWVFLLLYLVLRGPGLFSLDHLLSRWATAGDRRVAHRVNA